MTGSLRPGTSTPLTRVSENASEDSGRFGASLAAWLQTRDPEAGYLLHGERSASVDVRKCEIETHSCTGQLAGPQAQSPRFSVMRQGHGYFCLEALKPRWFIRNGTSSPFLVFTKLEKSNAGV